MVESLETCELLVALGDVCDEAALPSNKELAAVSMLLAAIGFKNKISKENMLQGMSGVLDKIYEELQ